MGKRLEGGTLTRDDISKGLRRLSDALYLLNRKDRRFKYKHKTRKSINYYSTPLIDHAFELFRHGWNEVETAIGILLKEYEEKEEAEKEEDA